VGGGGGVGGIVWRGWRWRGTGRGRVFNGVGLGLPMGLQRDTTSLVFGDGKALWENPIGNGVTI